VIVDDFHVMRSVGLPDKADAPLFVDSDAVLSGAVSLESLEPVSWRYAKIVQVAAGFDLIELPESYCRDPGPPLTQTRFKETFCISIFEALYHMKNI
jgi:hypothetical protein